MGLLPLDNFLCWKLKIATLAICLYTIVSAQLSLIFRSQHFMYGAARVISRLADVRTGKVRMLMRMTLMLTLILTLTLTIYPRFEHAHFTSAHILAHQWHIDDCENDCV